MSYELRGSGGYYRFLYHVWPEVLRLADKYGWKPAGTCELAPDGEHVYLDEKHSYMTNDGFVVMKTDARNLAAALSKAVRDSASRPRARKLAGRIEDVGGADGLREFIRFCRAGAFRIT